MSKQEQFTKIEYSGWENQVVCRIRWGNDSDSTSSTYFGYGDTELEATIDAMRGALNAMEMQLEAEEARRRAP